MDLINKAFNKRIISIGAIGLCVVTLGACAGGQPRKARSDGQKVHVLNIEYSSNFSHIELAQFYKKAAMTCWKKDSRFDGWTYAGFKDATDGPNTFEIKLRPTKGDKRREVNIYVQGGYDSNKGPGYRRFLGEKGGPSGLLEVVKGYGFSHCPEANSVKPK